MPGKRLCRSRSRWEVAMCASGLMSAQVYEAIWCPTLRKASSPVAIPAQISTRWSGLEGAVHCRPARSEGLSGQCAGP